MSTARLRAVLGLDLRHYLRRPLLWIWLLIVALCVLGLSTGGMTIQAGDSSTGGRQAHISSAFANGFELAILGALLYVFFVAFAAGMGLIRDRELRIEAILHSTPLRVTEYVWGRFGAALLVSLGVLALQVGLSALLKHQLTAAADPEIVGDFSLLYYAQPALLFSVPLIVFIAGVSFAIGERFRRPVLVSLFPLAVLLVSIFLFWLWTPSSLDVRVDRALMLLDPTGFRWLNETWLSNDRGAAFYNANAIGFDAGFFASRLALIVTGLGSVAASRRHLERNLRGERVSPETAEAALRAQAQRESACPAGRESIRRRPLAGLGMTSRRPSSIRAALLTAKIELQNLRAHPGVWLFLPLIVLNAIFDAIYSVGAFDTALLTTPGRSAVGSMSELTFSLLLFLMVFMVEGLRREETSRLAPIVHSTPVSNTALALGKLGANLVLALVPMVLVATVSIIVILVQGRVTVDLGPYVQVYGLLLFPTVIVWCCFIAFLYALTGNRFATYALGLGAMIGTGLQLAFQNMSWVWNWALIGAVRWTDLGAFELDHGPLLLNRTMVLCAALLFFVLAVYTLPRRKWDGTRVLERLRPARLVLGSSEDGGTLVHRLLPRVLTIVVVVLGFTLHRGIQAGPAGDRTEREWKNYWRKNVRTWLDRPNPDIVDATLALELEPTAGWLSSSGTFELENPHEEPLGEIALTGAPHWEALAWTLDGEPFEPDGREHLYVFELDEPLARGERATIGWEFEGTLLKGFSKNGAVASEFVLESGVVLTSFTPSFAPVVGYQEDIGIDDDNRFDARVFADDFYEGATRPAFGPSVPHPVDLTVTLPEEYRANGVGVLVEERVAEGRKTLHWVSDEPVRFFNVIAGRWEVHRGEGVAIYHHPEHSYNLDEMLTALEGAVRHYSEWFHPFPWNELKLSEFPSYAGYAQGFATNITFSEGIGFLTRDEEGYDPPFTVTAHEAAHQWWGNILMPGYGPGGNLLSEGTSEFSTILLVDQIKGDEQRIEFCSRLEGFYNERRVVDSERPLVEVDGTKDGDKVLTYNKMGWALWMLHGHMGREASLAGFRAFFDDFATRRDHPVIQDFLAHMRGFAPDPTAFDSFVRQWFFEVVLPEYELGGVAYADGEVRLTVENLGSGTMPVTLAVERGVRFPGEEDEDPEAFEESRATITLSAGEKAELTIPCPFEPERVLVDPDALVLQLGRERALHRF